MEKCAKLRSRSGRYPSVTEELIEQREEIEDLLENRQQIIDELEHDLNEAVEELNESLMYVFIYFIYDLFSHTNAYIFNGPDVET